MAHANQERWATLVDAKLRNQLVTRDNLIFNSRYEGDPTSGKVKIPVRDTEVTVKEYDKANGIAAEEGTTGSEHRPRRGRERADRRLRRRQRAG